jgi:hypothetical protein
MPEGDGIAGADRGESELEDGPGGREFAVGPGIARASLPPTAEEASHVARIRVARGVLSRASRKWPGQRAGAWTDGLSPFPVHAALRPVLSAGGLRRGATVAVGSSVSLVYALLSEASRLGFWCALVGFPDAGLVAAEEAGVALHRLALVPRPGTALAAVTAALLDGLDLVASANVGCLPQAERQRLAARARLRGSTLLAVGGWPGADLRVETASEKWEGIVPNGGGRLRSRRVELRVSGRATAHRDRTTSVLLPGPSGLLHEAPGLLVDQTTPLDPATSTRAAG